MNDVAVNTNSQLSISGVETPHAISRSVEKLPLEYWLSVIENNSALSVSDGSKINSFSISLPHILLTDAAKEALIGQLHSQLNDTSEDLDPEVYSIITENFEDLLWK